MASMARSGETVLLRTLQQHSQIHVVHNLRKQDNEFEENLFKHLMQHPKTTIGKFSKHLRSVDIGSDQVLLLKQSVWEHRSSFKGFILARNPLSIFASLKFYDVPKSQMNWENYWSENTARFKRWLSDIDPALLSGFENLSAVGQFCKFYNRRMGSLFDLGLPIIYYEKFVIDPETSLRKIMNLFGISWEDTMLFSHTNYAKSEEGHGKVDLSKPINSDSICKYNDLLSENELSEILDATREVYELYGYELERSGIKINGESVTLKSALNV